MNKERRERQKARKLMGKWLVPCEADELADFELAQPAELIIKAGLASAQGHAHDETGE